MTLNVKVYAMNFEHISLNIHCCEVFLTVNRLTMSFRKHLILFISSRNTTIIFYFDRYDYSNMLSNVDITEIEIVFL